MKTSIRARAASFVAVVLAACVLAACGGEDSNPQETAAPKSSAPPAPEMTLAEFGIDWPVADPMEFAPAPKTPQGFDEERFPQMVNTLRIWARASFLDEGVREAADPIGELRTKVGFEVGNVLEKSMRTKVGPRVMAANVFADDVEVLGPPVTTTAWKVVEKPGEATVTLQVRGVYRVRVDDGPERLVGVMRTNSLTGRAAAWESGLGNRHAWQAFSVETCPLALEDHLVPEEDLAEAKRGIESLVTKIKPGKVGPELVGDVDVVDEKLANRCRTEAKGA